MASDLREITREDVAKVNVDSAVNEIVLTHFSQHHTPGDLVPLVALRRDISPEPGHSGSSSTPSSMTCQNSTSYTRAEWLF